MSLNEIYNTVPHRNWQEAIIRDRRARILSHLEDGDMVIQDIANALNSSHSTIKKDVQILQKEGRLFAYRKSNQVIFTLKKPEKIHVREKSKTFDEERCKKVIIGLLQLGAQSHSRLYNSLNHIPKGAFDRIISDMVKAGTVKSFRDAKATKYTISVRGTLDELFAPMPAYTGRITMHVDSDDYHTMAGLTIKQGLSYGVVDYGGGSGL